MTPIGTLLATLGIGALWGGKQVFTAARDLQQVKLIRPQNAHLLPARKTLVRAAAPPDTAMQTELLRAARPATETPPEELLRAERSSPPI